MSTDRPSYRGYGYPPQIISHVVWLCHRFCLSLRDVEDVMAERGIVVSYETVRQWWRKFGLAYAMAAKRPAGQLGDTWCLDKVFVTIKGRRNQRAEERFFRKLLKGEGVSPRELVTDQLPSYSAARRTTMPSVRHVTARRTNNRAEASHQPTRVSVRCGVSDRLLRRSAFWLSMGWSGICSDCAGTCSA
jgi:putative transposase